MPERVAPPPTTDGHVVVLSGDLFFGMRIRTTLRGMGYAGTLVSSAEAFADAMRADDVFLGIVDFNRAVDWVAIAPDAYDAPVIAFGSHTDVDGFRAAKAAGVTRTISNGSFTEQLPALLERYAKR